MKEKEREEGERKRERKERGERGKGDEEPNPFSPTREKLIIHRVERT